MERVETLVCDCLCGEEAKTDREKALWFEIDQAKISMPNEPKPSTAPKLDRPVYLAGLECMLRWITQAIRELPEMIKTDNDLEPRGRIFAHKVPCLYI